ncbi:hypothetical protein D9619_008630 [Psilocybe cf. subviscida]|uniref:F-box domain-containing protein n=1 Tax=Psilocybe cf. subviscida TaxID=2480587 RepID=A0A8H5BA23_9AGAR|nr:hypothetical protein D9619_008630 [Psilocybe cf. subviscida]
MYPGHLCCSCYPRRNATTDLHANQHQSLPSIDSEILHIEGAIVHLVKRRALLKRRRNTFARVVNLPPEILALIFEYACIPSSKGDFASSSDMEERGTCTVGLTIGIGALTPLFLGSVCTAWRTVAFGASQLWSTLKIYVGKKDTERQTNLLREWLARSVRRPLSIKVIEEDVAHCNDDDNDSSSSAWGIDTTSVAIMDILAAHSKQWYDMDLFLPCTWRKALTRIRNDLPNLARLTLRGAHLNPSMARISAFALAPMLLDVSIVDTYLLDDVELPWGQLRRLQADAFNHTDCLRAIQLCPELRSCELERLCPSVVPPLDISVHHTQLETLILSTDVNTKIGAILGSLTLPALKELVLSMPQDGCVLSGVLPLVRRSQCPLTRLQLVGPTPAENDLVKTLRGIPTLEHLLLLNPVVDSGGKLTNCLLNQMANSGEAMEVDGETHRQSTLLPKLKTFEYQGPVGFSSHELVRFLESRWFPGQFVGDQAGDCMSPHLDSFLITTTSDIVFQPADSLILRRLRDEGMRLDFSVDCNVDNDSETEW